MSGVAVVIYQLQHSTPLTAIVPASRIMGGDLPTKTELPAISVTQISSVPRIPVAPSVTGEFTRDLVQVTVHAKTYPQLRQVLRLVRTGCPDAKGTIAGVSVDAILPGTEGPDFIDEAVGFFAGSRDFSVTWTT